MSTIVFVKYRADSPNNFINIIRATRPQSQYPGSGVGFQLEVPEVGHHDSVHELGVVARAQHELQPARGRAQRGVPRVPLHQQVLQLELAAKCALLLDTLTNVSRLTNYFFKT